MSPAVPAANLAFGQINKIPVGLIDAVESYFGLRSVKWDNNAILINGKLVFQRLVLDQGFYPEGIYTAPADEDLKRDMELSMSLGFNGARLHEKVFEARFLYWADQLGYIVWGEHANWGLDITTAQGLQQFLPEWIIIVKRDYNNPALVGWCPFNETWDGLQGTRQNDEVLRITYQVTKSLDAARPVIDTSGNFHVITDIFDVHDYEQNPEKFSQNYEARGELAENGSSPSKTVRNTKASLTSLVNTAAFGGIRAKPTRRAGAMATVRNRSKNFYPVMKA